MPTLAEFRLPVAAMRGVLGVPSAKVPANFSTLASYVLPLVVSYLVFAILAVTPQTRPIRVALWPVVALLALRAALSVDMSLGVRERNFLNVNLVLFTLLVTVRTLHWTAAKCPLVRVYLPPGTKSKSVVLQALDLACSIRGHGWEWSRGIHIPPETRQPNHTAFSIYVSLSAIVHTMLCGAFHRSLLTLAPIGRGPILEGSTIFDETLPFVVRYLRASIISILLASTLYTSLQMGYGQFTLPAVLLLGQGPTQWPPLFDAPWRSTSLGDFWGRRWHQWWRHTFLFTGGYPLSIVLGRTGIVLGSFLSSVALHYLTLFTLNGRGELRRMSIGFGMMALGILAERAFGRWTGRKVGGCIGWAWTMTWLLLWGNVIVEGFARAGLFDCGIPTDSFLPVRIPLEHWVAGFDAWLHTI